jgi:ribulose-5-phosphate 4-epimerase/fuculose-1-phosphate aldolase
MTDLSHAKIASLKSKVSPEEWRMRVDVAACYRLVALFGMNDLVYNHISGRVPGEEGHFLINPYGFAYEEVTASSLVKIDFDGKVVLDSGTGCGINLAGFVIHSAIHKARHDVDCVIHTHSVAGMAVSALKCGLLPLTQNAMFFGKLGYHDYESVAIDLDEQKRLVRDLGDGAAMVLRNHGLLVAGSTVCDAFVTLHWLEKACQAQLAAMACNTELNLPSPKVVELTNERYVPGQRRNITELEWPAMLRMLDRRDPSYRE